MSRGLFVTCGARGYLEVRIEFWLVILRHHDAHIPAAWRRAPWMTGTSSEHRFHLFDDTYVVVFYTRYSSRWDRNVLSSIRHSRHRETRCVIVALTLQTRVSNHHQFQLTSPREISFFSTGPLKTLVSFNQNPIFSQSFGIFLHFPKS